MEHFGRSFEVESEDILRIVYPEIKDLGKQFMTLVSGILAFTITFAEKIIGLANASVLPKLLLLFSWGAFIAAIGAIGVGLWWNYNVAMCALGKRPTAAWQTIRHVYFLYLAAGFSFVSGLGFLIAAGTLRLF